MNGTAKLRAARLVPILTSGAVCGVLVVVLATSFAALVFAGPLGIHLPAAIGFSLSGAVALLVSVAFLSSVPGAIGAPQDIPAAVLAVVAAGVAATRPPTDERTFLTVVLVVGLSAFASGVVFVALGTFRLGNLVRFVPYPVVGGFLAGTGWLLAKGAMGVLAGRPFSLQTVADFGEPRVAARWVPGLLFGAGLVWVSRRRPHPLIVPGFVVAGIVGFYATAALRGSTVGDVEASGWLLGPLPAGLWRPVLAEAAGADWGAVAGNAADLATVVFVSALALLLNASAIELVTNRDVDLDRELRAAGVGNLLAGASGGIGGFPALSLTALAHRSSAASRWTGIVAAAVVTGTLLFGASLLGLVPRVVVGGVVMFLGLGFLVEWVVDARRKLSFPEYLIVLFILIVIAATGFMQGVALGIVIALVLFAVAYSRTEQVRYSVSGAVFRSNVDRGPRESEVLARTGAQIHVLHLQGFLFFGTANEVLELIRERADAADQARLEFLVLDFHRVTGVDASAVLAFERAARMAAQRGFVITFSEVSPRVRRLLEQAGLTEGDVVRHAEDADRAVEWCEERILERAGVGATADEVPLVERIRARVDDGGVDPDRIVRYLERMELEPGQVLIRQGDSDQDAYFLERGRLTVLLRRDDGEEMRLRALGPGTVVGELGVYLVGKRTASVVADGPAVVFRLSAEARRRMAEEDPAAAAALHALLASILAERLRATIDTVEALMD